MNLGLRGGGAYLKFLDGIWSSKDGVPLPETPLLVYKTSRAIKERRDQMPVQTIVEDDKGGLPDLDELNKAVAVGDWELDKEGRPRPPFQLEHIALLVDPGTGKTYNFSSATVGAKIAVLDLRDQIGWVSAFRGPVLPAVELDAADMRTRHGSRKKPYFRVVGWQSLSSDENTQASRS